MSERVRVGLTVVLLLVAVAGATIGGCIRRYPAPAEPPPATHPYDAIATYRGITLPALPTGGQASEALPEAALRLAVGPGTGHVFADTALVDGREAGLTADGWSEGLALLADRPEPIVLLAHEAAMAPLVCESLAPLRDRLVVAAGVSHYEDGDGPPLGVVPLAAVCPGLP